MEVFHLNARGMKCPLPVIKARKAIKEMPAGSALRIECTDPLAEIDIPHMVQADGHSLVGRGRTDDVMWYLIALKTP